MGKGDPKTRRGKIFKGTFGKSRPKANKKTKGAGQPTPPPQAGS